MTPTEAPSMPCPKCEGTGVDLVTYEGRPWCRECNGTGRIFYPFKRALDAKFERVSAWFDRLLSGANE